MGCYQNREEDMPRKSLALLCEQDLETLTTLEWLRLLKCAASGMRKPYWRVFRSERPKCGAKCRDGHACKAPAVLDTLYNCYVRNGRCRNHGGLSTGPRMTAGKERIAEALRLRGQQRREAQKLQAPGELKQSFV